MLDTDTKRRIDTARDILVGKVPDPKSQVEQITIALIYKFMDDMDAESEELGGKRKFFTGDFDRFGWAKLMHAGLSGHETLNLYAEGITTMPQNPGIPPLFRDIFKNAYLPYRDPETLKSFLKIIDEFSYEHSERLGDAFEYLLSVLGSQGDAGQFRTPRHIIDFIVSIVDPKKTETILDPACGTAGFLISAYKHVLRANTNAKGAVKLTPDEKGRLAQHIKGYDISPDMVRLSLVNLYLHGFTDPHIYEYDTLTSEERWNEFADVILANPPFMSPKGGIKPHKKFSIDAKRSEVLFVDYMAEHFTTNGRAGIIVPEGIIFQSQGAYKDLRKMLVKNSLVAVISLPAGCFNPYSGVKTSILILDKSLAKQSETIGFFKVENDGFGLGAQRRAVNGSDLPQVNAEIHAYFQALRSQVSTANMQLAMGLIVPKQRITANGDCNLSGERYRDGLITTSHFPFVSISEVALVKNGFAFRSEEYVEKGLRVMRIKNVQRGEVIDEDPKFIAVERMSEFSDFALKAGDILMSLTGNVGRVGRLRAEHEPAVLNQRVAHIQVKETTRCLPQFLFALLNTEKLESDAIAGSSGVAQANLSSKWVADHKIPLPPMEVQNEIVAEIVGYQKVIDGARAVLDNYRPHIPIHPDWPIVPLGEICSIGGSITTDVDLALPYFGADSIESNTAKLLKAETARSQGVNGPVYEFDGERLLYSKIRPYLNKLTVVDLKGYCSSDMYPLLPTKSKVQITYLATYMLSDSFNERIRGYYERASIPKINRSQLFETEIPLPPLTTQKIIVAEIEAEQALVTANRELIARFEMKIQGTLARVWGEDEPAAPEA